MKGWKISTDVPWAENVYEAAVPEGSSYSRDLYVDGRRAELASEKLINGEFSNRDNGLGGYMVTGSAAEMANWKNKDDIEFYYDIGWTSNILPVKDIVNEAGGTRVLMKPEPFQASDKKLYNKPNKPTGVQNAIEVLDSPNEWYYDRSAGKIYYIPEAGQNPEDSDIVLPTITKLIEVKGNDGNKVNGLAFKDISFCYTSYIEPHNDGRIEMQAGMTLDPEMEVAINHDSYIKTPAAFSVSYAEGMRLRGCAFAYISACGLDFDIGVTASTVIQSRFEQIGGTGIQVGGVKVRDAQPFSEATYDKGVLNENAGMDPGRITEDILVYSNTLETIGNNFRGSIGIFAGYVRDFTASNNQISNVAYSAMSLGWGWGIWDEGGRSNQPNYYKFKTPGIQERFVAENNNISTCMQRLNDGGAIYTLSKMPGSVIRGNYIHDVPNPYGAIYLDEATSGIADISKNIVFNVYRPYFYHDPGGFGKEAAECMAVQHDNFFTVGQPEDPENPEFIAIKGSAGILAEMVPPELGSIPELIDKTELENLISEAQAKELEQYTAESGKHLQEMLEAALGVFGDDNVGQADVNRAAENLKAAIEALEKSVDPKPDPTPDPTPDPKPDPKPDPTPDPKPDPTPDPKPDPTPDSKPDQTPLPAPNPAPEQNPVEGEVKKSLQTGDDMNVYPFIFLILSVGGLTGSLLYMKKKKDKNT